MEPVIGFRAANCKNCYQCLRACPTKAIRFSSEEQGHVSPEICIYCGKCATVCHQGAVRVGTDLPEVRRMIAGGAKVYASVAPSYAAAFPGASFAQISAALKKLGFVSAEETAIGATEVSKEYARLMAAGNHENLIATCCPALVMLVEKHYPELVAQLAPVASPAVVHGKMLKNMFGTRIKTVFIGPCVAKKEEARQTNAINAVLLFEELRAWMRQEGVRLEEEDPEPAEMHATLSRLYPSPGGIVATIPPEKRRGYKSYFADGPRRCREALDAMKKGQVQGYFMELSICEGSCVHGPGIEEPQPIFLAREQLLASARKRTRTPAPITEQTKVPLEAKHRPVRPAKTMPEEQEIAAILAQTGKHKPEDMLNCGACGYPTCREKAIAVAQGRADIRMCLPYMREKAESTSNMMMEYAPNAMLLLDDRLRVIEANKRAVELLEKQGQPLKGRTVSEILKGDLKKLLAQGEPVRDEPCQAGARRLRCSIVQVPGGEYLMLLRDMSRTEDHYARQEEERGRLLEIARKSIDKQLAMAQEVTRLMGETTGEALAALMELQRESVREEPR